MVRVGLMAWTLLGFVVLAGLANKGISFILLEGQVFNWLRDGLRSAWVANETTPVLGFILRELVVLFDCPLCMTAQVGIWVFGLPAGIFIIAKWHPFSRLPIYGQWGLDGLLIFLLSMAVGAAGFGWYSFLQYPAKKLEGERRFQEETLNVQRLAALADCDKNLRLPPQEVFVEVFVVVEEACRNECPCSRETCRERKLKERVVSWAKANGNGHENSQSQQEILIACFSHCRDEFPDILRPGLRERILEDAYAFFVASVKRARQQD